MRDGERLRLLESALDAALDAVVISQVVPEETYPQIIYVNDAFTRQTGYAAEEVIGKTLQMFHGPETDQIALDKIRAALIERRPVVAWMVNYRKDGSTFWVEVSIVPVPGGEGSPTHWVAIYRDITDRKLAEQERVRHLALVQAAEAHYRTLFESMADAALLVSPSGEVMDANPAAVDLLGYGRDELTSLTVQALIPASHQALTTMLWQLQGASSWSGELEIQRSDGTVLTAEARVATTCLPNGAGYLAVIRDISARRAVEEMQRNFVAVVSHELLTPLTTLKAVSELLEERGVGRKRAVEAIATQVRRLERLTGDVLNLARQESGQLTLRRSDCDLREIARGAVAQTKVVAPGYEVKLRVPSKPCRGSWDHERIEQVLQNLLSNAIKYSPDGSTIDVRVEHAGAFARVRVSDQGVGIPAEALPHLFDRFYRVQRRDSRAASGLGLGLYIARWVVEAHGGHMMAESTPGEGSTFTFTLPVGEGAEAGGD